MEDASVQLVGAGLGDHVHNATAGAAKFRAGARGDHLELLHRVKADVHGSALSAGLLTEEAVVVVTAVQADVVKDAALPVEIDLVAVRSLRDADARCKGQQVLKLSAQNGSICNRTFVERGT